MMHVDVQTFILLMMVDSPWIRFKYKKNIYIYNTYIVFSYVDINPLIRANYL